MGDKLKYSKQEIAVSKKNAFDEIVKILQVGDIEKQFEGRSGDYHSQDKFIVSWIDNYKGMPSEFSLDLTDSFYSSYSGNKCIYATRSLFHEKQLDGFRTIERGLLAVGLKVCSDDEKNDYFNKFIRPYNERLEKEREKSDNPK